MFRPGPGDCVLTEGVGGRREGRARRRRARGRRWLRGEERKSRARAVHQCVPVHYKFYRIGCSVELLKSDIIIAPREHAHLAVDSTRYVKVVGRGINKCISLKERRERVKPKSPLSKPINYQYKKDS